MKKAVMYGAGNIGRGFIAQLFCMSGYETVFIDVNEEIVAALNRDRSYPIYITEGETYRPYIVENVRAVSGRDEDAVAAEIASADVAATAVGAGILKYIARPVAKGISRRAETGTAELNIIICENLIDADKYFRSLVSEHLDAGQKRYLEAMVGMAEASVGRMVPAAPPELREKNSLAVCVEPYCALPVDRAGFRGKIPEIANLEPGEPFDFFIRRKLYMHNMAHAAAAYLGARRGYKYIWEAAADHEIRYIALGALIQSASALSEEYGAPLRQLIDFSYELLGRFDNKLLGDTVERVGRDTRRKLAKNDRLAGPIELCLSHGIYPSFIIYAAAAALAFTAEGDDSSAEVAAFAAKEGPEAALRRYSELTDQKVTADIAALYIKMTE